MRRAVRFLLFVFAVAVVAAIVWGAVEGGRYLQHEDPLRKADAIFVLGGTRLERPLEAVDLYREGWAPVVALNPGRPEAVETLVRDRGVRFPKDLDLVRDAMTQLGVPASAIVTEDVTVDNTAEEARLLRALALRRHWRTVIVVTSKYHTRRTGFALRRALRGSGVEIVVRATRYDMSDPANWWRRRADFRFALSEWQKLVAYRLGLAD
jgi:uncharacterized SAM-binding protein YcdF (DUF218 family)